MQNILQRLLGKGSKVNYSELIAGGAVIVDVRTPGEFSQGHIAGAVNIPLDGLKQQLPALKAKNIPVITCCRSGARSGIAKGLLTTEGITCYNGGAWTTLDQQLKNKA